MTRLHRGDPRLASWLPGRRSPAGPVALATHASPRGHAGDGRLRLLLVRGQARPAHRVGRHHRRRHAADEQRRIGLEKRRRAAGRDPGVAARHRRRR